MRKEMCSTHMHTCTYMYTHTRAHTHTHTHTPHTHTHTCPVCYVAADTSHTTLPLERAEEVKVLPQSERRKIMRSYPDGVYWVPVSRWFGTPNNWYPGVSNHQTAYLSLQFGQCISHCNSESVFVATSQLQEGTRTYVGSNQVSYCVECAFSHYILTQKCVHMSLHDIPLCR